MLKCWKSSRVQWVKRIFKDKRQTLVPQRHHELMKCTEMGPIVVCNRVKRLKGARARYINKVNIAVEFIGLAIQIFVSIRACFFFGLLMQRHQSDAMKAFVWHLNTYRTNSFWFALCVCHFSSVCFWACVCVHFASSVSMMDPDLHVVKRNEWLRELHTWNESTINLLYEYTQFQCKC